MIEELKKLDDGLLELVSQHYYCDHWNGDLLNFTLRDKSANGKSRIKLWGVNGNLWLQQFSDGRDRRIGRMEILDDGMYKWTKHINNKDVYRKLRTFTIPNCLYVILPSTTLIEYNVGGKLYPEFNGVYLIIKQAIERADELTKLPRTQYLKHGQELSIHVYLRMWDKIGG